MSSLRRGVWKIREKALDSSDLKSNGKGVSFLLNKEQFMTDAVPTNIEMYNRICGGNGLHNGDRMALAYWNDLVSFSKSKNLLESNFEGRIKNNFHECFWEIYLPKAFNINGVCLRREGKCFPDFCF